MTAPAPHPPAAAPPRAATADASRQPAPALPPWRPTTRRHKLLLVALTLATVLGLAYVLQRPHQRLVAAKAARQDAACQADAASRPAGCPGAPMPVMVLPVTPTPRGPTAPP